MLNLNPETVCLLIEKAHEFHSQEQVVVSEEPTSYGDDWDTQILAAHASDPTYMELKSIIKDLEPDQQISLVALMWLGRGDFSADEWNKALEQAEDNWNNRTAEYLIGTPLVADYRADGLVQLGYSCE
jgi:hypothetical protein